MGSERGSSRRFELVGGVVRAQALAHRELEEALERRDQAARGARLGATRLHLPREVALQVVGQRPRAARGSGTRRARPRTARGRGGSSRACCGRARRRARGRRRSGRGPCGWPQRAPSCPSSQRLMPSSKPSAREPMKPPSARSSGDHAVAWHDQGNRIGAAGAAHGARRRAQLRGELAVGARGSPRESFASPPIPPGGGACRRAAAAGRRRSADRRGRPGSARTRGARSIRAPGASAGTVGARKRMPVTWVPLALMPSVAKDVRTQAWNGTAERPPSATGRTLRERLDPFQQVGRDRDAVAPRRVAVARRGARPAGARPGPASSPRPGSRRAPGTRPGPRARRDRSRGMPARCAWGALRPTKKLSDSKPNAAPESAHTSNSTMRASIAPFAPPAGSMLPSSAARASVVGWPSLSSAQPSGIGLPSRAATMILPRATAESDRSMMSGGAVAAREHGGDRIGAEERALAAPGGHRRGRVAEREPDQARFGHGLEVVGRDAEVIAVGDRDVRHAVLARARRSPRAPASAQASNARPCARVHQARGLAVARDDRHRRRRSRGRWQVPAILRDARSAVRADAVQLPRARARAPSPRPRPRSRPNAAGRRPSGARARRRVCAGDSWADERLSGANAGEVHRFPCHLEAAAHEAHARVGGSWPGPPSRGGPRGNGRRANRRGPRPPRGSPCSR